MKISGQFDFQTFFKLRALRQLFDCLVNKGVAGQFVFFCYFLNLVVYYLKATGVVYNGRQQDQLCRNKKQVSFLSFHVPEVLK